MIANVAMMIVPAGPAWIVRRTIVRIRKRAQRTMIVTSTSITTVGMAILLSYGRNWNAVRGTISSRAGPWMSQATSAAITIRLAASTELGRGGQAAQSGNVFISAR